MKKAFIFLIFVLLVSAATILLLRNKPVTEHHYIAHAGGAIDGHPYTNSLEAVENSLKKGMQFIELDLALTTDSVLVALHDWNSFNQLTESAQGKAAMTYSEFKQQKIHGKYTPIDYLMIDSIMSNNPDLYLVTDKLSNPEILDKFLGKYRDRIVVEAFSEKDYFELKTRGYHDVMYSIYTSAIHPIHEIYRYQKLVNSVVTEIARLQDTQKSTMHKLHHFITNSWYGVFAAKNKSQADSIFEQYPEVKYVYIDEV